MTKAITKNSKKGFTLVELVIVIAILAILAAIAIPVVNSIINTASKNGALSNAETIELAVKECQADIAAKNDEVYNGQGTIPKASTQHGNIDITHVATVKAIDDAFKVVTYNGKDYIPYWNKVEDKCIFVTGGAAAGGAGGSLTDIEGNAVTAANVVALADNTGKPTATNTKIDSL